MCTGLAMSLLQCQLPTGSYLLSNFHLLQHGALHRLQVDLCFTVDLHELQGDTSFTMVITMGGVNPQYESRLGDEQIKSSPVTIHFKSKEN